MAASSLRFLFPPHSLSLQKPTSILNCTSNPTSPLPEPDKTSLETQKKLSLLKEQQQQTSLTKQEPPNFEIGWKRTKPINLTKPKGWQIADFLEKLESLMDRKQYGSKELLAKVGHIVAERSREEMEVLRGKGEIDERMVIELERVLKLMEMDFEMVKAAVKDETVSERVETAKARCRQAILVALSF